MSNNATPQTTQEESGAAPGGLTVAQLAEAAQLGAGRFADPVQAARLLDPATVNALGVAAAVEKIAVDHPWALAQAAQAQPTAEESAAAEREAKDAEMRAMFYGGKRSAVFGPPPPAPTAEQVAKAEARKAKDAEMHEAVYRRKSTIFGQPGGAK